MNTFLYLDISPYPMANSNDGLWAVFVGILVLIVVVGLGYIFIISSDNTNARTAQQSSVTYVPYTVSAGQTFEVPSQGERLILRNNRLEDRVDSLERQLSQSQSSLQSMRLENERMRDDFDRRRFRFRGCDDWDDCDDLKDELEDEEEENDDLRDRIDELCEELEDHDIDSDEC
jgi:predicted RNase H-like nuclease (RuvC/YqgF family)